MPCEGTHEACQNGASRHHQGQWERSWGRHQADEQSSQSAAGYGKRPHHGRGRTELVSLVRKRQSG